MLEGNWLSELCDRLESDEKVKISDYARQLILMTATAAEFDPHPAWANAIRDGQISRKEMQSIIESELSNLVTSPSVRDHGRRVTYFHVLHWIAESKALLGWPVPKDKE